jgi:hypothetical protein
MQFSKIGFMLELHSPDGTSNAFFRSNRSPSPNDRPVIAIRRAARMALL